MSSIDQAFVKAFSRRSRTASPETVVPQEPVSVPEETVAESVSSTEAQPVQDPGSLKVDPSVAQSASVWVDPIESEIARADSPDSQVPKPHIVSGNAPISASVSSQQTTLDQRIESLQHIHTAYAVATFTDDPAVGTGLPVVVDDPAEPPQDGPLVQTRIDPPAPRFVPEPSDHAEESSAEGEGNAAEEVSVADNDAIDAEASIEPGKAEVFVAPTLEPFRASWEVDVFDVPNTVADLFFEGRLFQQIAERMVDVVGAGLKSMLVTSIHGGEGRTSVAIGIAMAAAAAGTRVALVDGDTAAPSLAEELRLDLQHSWLDTVRGGVPLKEIAVHAVEDGLTLIPLLRPSHQSAVASPYETAQLMELLKDRFELIIMDGGHGTSQSACKCAAEFDSVVIVRDTARTGASAVNEFSEQLQAAGVQGIGIVENFA